MARGQAGRSPWAGRLVANERNAAERFDSIGHLVSNASNTARYGKKRAANQSTPRRRVGHRPPHASLVGGG
jgi:hypothetical protein